MNEKPLHGAVFLWLFFVPEYQKEEMFQPSLPSSDRIGCFEMGKPYIQSSSAMQISSKVIVLLIGAALLILTLMALLLFHRPAVGAPALKPESQQADRIVIEKAARRMTLFRDNIAIGTFAIKLGFAPQGDKVQEGDGKTPEGIYHIDRRNNRSSYHLSLGLTYPTAAELREAKAKGINPGRDIFIHGQPNRLGDGVTLPFDWTDGCVAVSNEEIREIWSRVPIGTEVDIRP